MEIIIKINDFLSDIAWGWPAMILLVGTGVYLTIRLGFPQVSKFGLMFRNAFSKNKGSSDKSSVSPFRAFSTALSGTVGTGNVVGVSGAIIAGGPGAVFWLWVSGIFGMATKFSEVTLAVKYRQTNKQGDRVGGPMYYIRDGLGQKWNWLSIVFCCLGALAAFGIGCLSQISSMVSAISSAFIAFSIPTTNLDLTVGIITAVVLAFVIIGGIQRISKEATALTPIMSFIYIFCSLYVIIANIDTLPSVLRSIFVGAFTPKAVLGGVVGISFKHAVSNGVSRGLFSNEAGQGSAPIAHAATDAQEPVKQGLMGMFEVFVDTIVICSLTCLSVLMSGINIEYVTGNRDVLPVLAFSSVFGDKAGSLIVAICLTLFAFTTMITWSLYGVRCFEYLIGSEKLTLIYRLVFVGVVIYGSTVPLGLAYSISNTLNGLMAIPNLVAVIGLSGVVIKLTKEYFEKNK